MNWQRFSRRDCPVCGGTRKDCRQNALSKLIHCRELDAAPSGYVFRGYDSLGFGMWAEQGDVEAWTEEKRNEWQERRKQEQAIEQARFKSLLIDSERDLTLRSILNQLDLSEEHRLQLRERGMSKEQIEAGLYRTVEPWQRLQFRVDDRLAGVLRGGKGLYIPASGILCPIPNHKGELVGWQLRLDDPGEFPKYLWASSEKKRRKNGPSAHLKNGELPLAYFAPSIPLHAVISQGLGQQSGHATLIPVALTEGVGFKPALTAHRLGIDTIGASGGHFAASPQTLNAYLEGIKTLHGEKNQQEIALQPILFADGGCLANENVLQVYAHTIRQLQELGYEAKIAWWGQVDKSDGDIDEIGPATLASLRLLSWSEFCTLVKKTRRDSQVETVQQRLQSLSYEPSLRLNERYLPDLAEIIPWQGMIALKSPKGSGKSIQIQKIIESARSRGMQVISLTPRRALGREQSLKWDIDWAGDAEVTGIHPLTLLENLPTLGICWDSLWKLRERDWSRTLVIIDEAELALVHLLLSSTCKEKRPLILRVLETKLQECLAHGGIRLLADADLTDLSIDYVRSLVPEVPVFTISNEYQGVETQWQVDFHTGKKDTAIAQLIADLDTPVIEGEVERQRRLVIPTDSQDQAEALERFIRERFPHLLTTRIDSTTTETEAGRAFVERPNEMILALRPDVLIYTPSMGAGVSIDVPWFDRMYAFFNGVIEPSQCRQMLGRVRATIPRTLWCRQRGQVEGSSSFFPGEIKSHLFTFHRQTSILIDVARAIAPDNPTDWQIRQAYDAIWNREIRAWDNPHVDLYCNLMARKNYGLFHLAAELRRQLLAEGHLLIDSQDNDNTDEGLRVSQIKKQLPIEEAQAIALAQDIPLELALLLKQKPNLTEQQRHQITKALLSAELPGVTLDPAFIYKAVTKDHRKWLNAQKLFWYCQHPEQVKVMDRREWLNRLSQFSQGVVYLPDIRTYSLQVKVLHNIGLFEAIDLNCPDLEYSSDGEVIQRLLKQARKFSRSIRTAFDLRVTQQTKPIQFVNHLLNRVGLHLKFHRQITKGERFYRLDLDRLNDLDRIAVLDSLSQRWGQLGSESSVGDSQQEPIEINNTVLCCEPLPSTPLPESAISEEQRDEVPQEELIWQLGSETSFGESQQEPISINNTVLCCEPSPSTPSPESAISEKPRNEVPEEELICATAETFLSRLWLAIESFKFPQVQIWLWKALKAEITEPIAVPPYLSPDSQCFLPP